jgi:hypothetical protein
MVVLGIWEGIEHRAGSETEVDGNYKSQNSNNKQIPMTEIRNSKPQHDLNKRIPNMFGSLNIGI